MGRGAVQTSTPVGPQAKISDGVPETTQNASVKWSAGSSPVVEMGGALDCRPRQSRIARVASGGWIAASTRMGPEHDCWLVFVIRLNEWIKLSVANCPRPLRYLKDCVFRSSPASS